MKHSGFEPCRTRNRKLRNIVECWICESEDSKAVCILLVVIDRRPNSDVICSLYFAFFALDVSD
jgi:hypothetical protein